MAIAFDKLQKILQNSFPNANIELVDLVGDSDHYSVTIIDKIFANKSRVEQHKMVNLALKEILGDELHALQIKTLSP
jgi:stress-induced morphogen